MTKSRGESEKGLTASLLIYTYTFSLLPLEMIFVKLFCLHLAKSIFKDFKQWLKCGNTMVKEGKSDENFENILCIFIFDDALLMNKHFKKIWISTRHPSPSFKSNLYFNHFIPFRYGTVTVHISLGISNCYEPMSHQLRSRKGKPKQRYVHGRHSDINLKEI